ncbi:LysR family transcriptional regulator [Actinoplanes couchii]|uniref:LysR family transcriptional regulator n=1 Tax=Actinoplanes couchii TaxID=403638 RepID=A0ABQ3X7W7_9ACTN|nr:LysR family transcriptional regulator [Actinoplanes couchii]MDR6320416.1 DNA-binding transcriptional LysR family regulator [Actinoplanes couchii]GID54572.1 LysR family transcriptional regulator [Actinoplanes couchii]
MQLDLNLLTVLDALLTEGSVMGAADRLHLSSPAVSRSLGRIRRLTGDDILVRTGRTMTPTPYAITIRDQVSALLTEAERVLQPRRDLDLPTLDRTFTLRCHDALTAAMAPALLAATIRTAPRVRLRFLTESSGDSDDLRHGRVDLEIGASVPEQPEFRTETIGRDRLVVVTRPGHPYRQGEDLEVFAAQPHVLLSRRGRLTDPVDDLLAERGLRRTVIASVGSTASALRIVAGSDALMIAAEVTCGPLIEAFGLVTAPAPVELPRVPVVAVWHQRYDTEPGHAWLRDRVREVLRTDQRFSDQLLR